MHNCSLTKVKGGSARRGGMPKKSPKAQCQACGIGKRVEDNAFTFAELSHGRIVLNINGPNRSRQNIAQLREEIRSTTGCITRTPRPSSATVSTTTSTRSLLISKRNFLISLRRFAKSARRRKTAGSVCANPASRADA